MSEQWTVTILGWAIGLVITIIILPIALRLLDRLHEWMEKVMDRWGL